MPAAVYESVTDDNAWRVPVGAEVADGRTRFRVWAPHHRTVDAVFDSDRPPAALSDEADGYFSAMVSGISAGARYKYRLDGADAFPDPASRFQPEGPHHWSEVVDGRGFAWTDGSWKGLSARNQVIYEMHIGTFTPEGTWAAAASKLKWLRDTGVTALEVMPVNEFPGRFGWGYDGVHWFAPTRLYGRPDNFRAFVDRAHALGLGVILDVVYNHFGPDGNYLGQFSKDYFNEEKQTEWGCAINYDGPNSGPVRGFVVANAAYWIREFHLDGLRLDATQSIDDSSPEHVIAALTRAAREAAAPRSIIVVGENEPQHSKLARRPEQGGYGLDMLWNDDYHHSAMVAMTGHNEAYYTDYLGTPQEFISAAKYGYLYQGQWYLWQDSRRGKPAFGLPPEAFVDFTQNHDQIANSATGQRCIELTSIGRYKAVTALTVLMPGTPMLFQGQEFGATTPFYYFADHHGELAELVRKGRTEFMLQFATVATREMTGCLPDPADRNAFERCKLDWSEAERNGAMVRFHRDLIRLRREDATFSRAPKVDGAVLGPEGFLLRYFGSSPEDDRLLVINLGRDLSLRPAPEPLLAPPEDRQWDVMWSSEDPRYGGCGTPALDTGEGWRTPGHSAVVMKPGPLTTPTRGDRPLEHLVRKRNVQRYERNG